MFRVLAAVAWAALWIGSVARGAETAVAPQSLAVELTRMVMPEGNWNRTVQGLGQQVDQFIEATAKVARTSLPPNFASDVMNDLVTYQEVVDMAAGVYAKHYTDAELRDLVAFYRSPTGQKTIRLMPEILQDVNGQMLAIVQQRMQTIMEKLKARISQYAAEHPARAASGAESPKE